MENKKIIQEGLSPVVYHYTYIANLVKICQSNEFKLSIGFASSDESSLNRGRLYYMSTTRSRSDGWTKGNVRIVLDGTTLNRNYKAFPVSFFKATLNKSNEMEDRIVNDHPIIKYPHKYITEVHIESDTIPPVVYNYFNKYGIPIFLYADRSSFLGSRRGNPATKNNISSDIEDIDAPNQVSSEYSYIIALLSLSDKSTLNRIEDKYSISSDMLNTIKQHIKYLESTAKLNTLQKESHIKRIKREIRNTLSIPITNEPDRFVVGLLSASLKNNKVNSIHDYLHKILNTNDNLKNISTANIDIFIKESVYNMVKEVHTHKKNITYKGVNYNNITQIEDIKQLYKKVVDKVEFTVKDRLTQGDQTSEMIEDLSLDIDDMILKFSRIIYNHIKQYITKGSINSEYIYDTLSIFSDSFFEKIKNYTI